MNNLTFGVGNADLESSVSPSKGFGYCETIAGGAGAGPNWTGASGVHTHMANTRITDPEVLEKRYPVILREFGLRDGSGGVGQFKGGDGVVRDLEFKVGMWVSVLTERRARASGGRNGGEDGKAGVNLWIKGRVKGEINGVEDGEEESKIVSLGGKASVWVEEGDRIVLRTPGGGGWGKQTAPV